MPLARILIGTLCLIAAFFSVVTLEVEAAAPAVPGAVASPSCDMLSKEPKKYIGQTVTFLGTVFRGELRPSTTGQYEAVLAWRCKTHEGRVIEGAVFAFVDANANWTAAAKKADNMKELFRISGTVKGTVVIAEYNPSQRMTLPLLARVQVALASESIR